jgi:hypothetical protein
MLISLEDNWGGGGGTALILVSKSEVCSGLSTSHLAPINSLCKACRVTCVFWKRLGPREMRHCLRVWTLQTEWWSWRNSEPSCMSCGWRGGGLAFRNKCPRFVSPCLMSSLYYHRVTQPTCRGKPLCRDVNINVLDILNSDQFPTIRSPYFEIICY